jgi:hypothetical protein
MRRLVFTALVLLECLAALALVGLGWQLPGREQIENSFARAGRVSARAGDQARRLQERVGQLRRPELRQLAERLRDHTRTVSALLRERTVDFQTVAALRDSLGGVSDGLHSFADTLDPDAVGKLGEGLSRTADFLDQKLVPAAEEAAKKLHQSTALLRADARALSDFLQAAPVDLHALREVHDSLGAFSKGLEKIEGLLALKRLTTLRQGFRGMESALNTGADQVERLASYTYPVLQIHRWRPEIEMRQFWPTGDRIAEGLRSGGAGVAAAAKEIDELEKSLPQLRAALEGSRKIVDTTRETLAVALEHQDQLEPLLKELPRHAARLAEQLPQVGADLARVLRDTDKVREVAGALRQARKGLDSTVGRWPELRQTLLASSEFLHGVRKQLDRVVRQREDYERAAGEAATLGEMFATMLPLLTDGMLYQLGDDERSLGELGQSLDEVATVLPEYGRTAGGLVQTGRWLAWLAAAAVLLHAVYLFCSTVPKRASPTVSSSM